MTWLPVVQASWSGPLRSIAVDGFPRSPDSRNQSSKRIAGPPYNDEPPAASWQEPTAEPTAEPRCGGAVQPHYDGRPASLEGLADGKWRSLAARSVRDAEAAGSNPAFPTKTPGRGAKIWDTPARVSPAMAQAPLRQTSGGRWLAS